MTAQGDTVRPFGVSVDFGDHYTVLGVTGEVDLVTGPMVDAIVSSVIDGGHRAIVLDLARCDFLDARGLRSIASAIRRLAEVGAVLTVRSPSAMVGHLLETSGIGDLVHLEQERPVTGPEPSRTGPVTVRAPAGHLGPEEVARGSGTGGETVLPDVVRPLRRITAVPADDDVVDGALRLVVDLARATVGGADGVSVSLRRHGRLSTVAATDQTILDMDTDQYDTGEGPCVDASVEGRWFHAEALGDETRWPTFVPRARALGINAILSSPLLAGARPVGALNIYSRAAAAFTPQDRELAATFASGASAILTEAGAGVGSDELAGRLTEALEHRAAISQAQGVLMARHGLSAEAAYTVLLRSSIQTGTPLQEGARMVVAAARRPRASSGEGLGDSADG